MDDEDYASNAIRKIWDYERNGIFIGDRLIITMETKVNQLNSEEARLLIARTFGIDVK